MLSPTRVNLSGPLAAKPSPPEEARFAAGGIMPPAPGVESPPFAGALALQSDSVEPGPPTAAGSPNRSRGTLTEAIVCRPREAQTP